jgi:hypothetical protein
MGDDDEAAQELYAAAEKFLLYHAPAAARDQVRGVVAQLTARDPATVDLIIKLLDLLQRHGRKRRATPRTIQHGRMRPAQLARLQETDARDQVILDILKEHDMDVWSPNAGVVVHKVLETRDTPRPIRSIYRRLEIMRSRGGYRRRLFPDNKLD